MGDLVCSYANARFKNEFLSRFLGKKSGMSWSLSLFWKLFVLWELFPWSWLQCGELSVTVFADAFLRLAGLHFKSPWCLFACSVCSVTSIMLMIFLGIYPSPTANIRSCVVLVPTFVLQTLPFSSLLPKKTELPTKVVKNAIWQVNFSLLCSFKCGLLLYLCKAHLIKSCVV